MRVFILGGTGSIGSAVTQQLVAEGHEVIGLCRSDASARKLSTAGARPHFGNLTHPSSWAAPLAWADAVVQLAITFDDDMGEIDASAMQAVMAEARQRSNPLRLIYTGGCWLYGETRNRIAHESSPMRPISAFAWMQKTAATLLDHPGLSCCVIHPAMVYHEEGGGAFARMIDMARTGRPVEIWGSLKTRWPLVHRQDLARAYAMLVARPDLTGPFNVAAQSGVPVRDILQEIARRYDHDASYVVRSRKHLMFKHGAWAEGPTLDQQMSAARLSETCKWRPTYQRFTQAAF